jgi:3-oxoacyl-[acyl-carrier protein] reductase
MDLGLAGKIALVGGGSRGIGRATAQALAREGASVALFARSADDLELAVGEINAATGVPTVALPTDVTQAEDCERAVAETVERLGGLDVLVTNMGGPRYRSELPEDEADWRAALDLVTLSVIRLCRLAVPHMQARGGGSIVVITTTAVHQLIPGVSLSGVSRLATTGFANYLATELAPQGIRVNTLLPGWIATRRVIDLAEGEARERGVPLEQVYAEQTEAIPLGRFGDPDEIADAVVWLASERSSYVTGVNLRVDGGWCLNPAF